MVSRRIGMLVAMLAGFQLARWGLESLAFAVVPHTLLTNELVRTGVYLLLCAVLVLWARHRKVALTLVPPQVLTERHSRGVYGAALAGFAVLFGVTPLLTGQAHDPAAWAALACGALATPLFEELLFRGYLWERLKEVCPHAWQVIVGTAVLFGLWHLGYLDAVSWRMAQPDMLLAGGLGLVETMVLKVGFAAVMGLVLGYLRVRSGGCLAPMLFHGFWNLLA